MKRAGILAVAVMLSMLVPAWCAYAESRDAQVCYEVSATVIYVDGTTETVQRVSVGSVLKAPEPKGSADSMFAGWWNEESGTYWDFSTPVEGDMTLTARYVLFASERSMASVGASVSKDGRDDEARSLLETGDALVPLALPVLLVGSLAAGLAYVGKRFRRGR